MSEELTQNGENLWNKNGEAEKVVPPVVPAPVLPNVRAEESDAPTSYPSFLKEPIESGLDSESSASNDFAQAPAPPVVPHIELETVQTTEDIPEPPTIPQVEAEPMKSTENIPAPPVIPQLDPEIIQQAEEPQENFGSFSSSEGISGAEDDVKEQSQPLPPIPPAAPSVDPIIPVIPKTDEKNFGVTAEEVSDSSENRSEETQTDTDYRSESFLRDLFANNNECVTAPNGSFAVKDDTRSLLALFTNGRFFVAEEARFDGKVLGFEYLARKRRFQIGKAEYVPSVVINGIYEYAAQNTTRGFITPSAETDTQEQVRMQRDFVTIVSRAAMNHVSDIHIVVAEHTTVMFRVNGLMQTEMEYNKEWGESFVRAAFASADISDANYAQNEYQAAQKLGRTPLRGSGGQLILPRNVLGIRLQFNPIAFGTRYVVMRLLYAEDDTNATNLAALGFSEREMDIFRQIRSIPTGMVIISGPTGSGKSTTLQRNMIAMLQERNYEFNLITVEDPPEYPIPGARQMPVTNAMIEEAKDREFTKALSAALRSDPDSLMIGEIRTLAAADLAFRGALSGHSVWTTLHTNSAPAVIMRLKDIGVEDFKLQDPSIMKALVAQRLFRKLCPHCRLKAANCLDNPVVQRLRRALGDEALERCYVRGPGCEACDMRGVSGRTVIGEFLLPDSTFLDLSVRGEFNKAMNYWINDLNGVTLREAAISRMLEGVVDVDEVERWTGLLDQPTLA